MESSKRLVTLLCLLFAHSIALAGTHQAKFQSAGHSIPYEIFENKSPTAPILILLPGTSGPEAPFYRSQADFFADKGYEVLLLHFFDAAPSRTPDDQTYEAWSTALSDLVLQCNSQPEMKGRPMYVVGYSLGASVALAAGSQGLSVKAIAEWYGSLPDSFFERFSGMPPLLILHGALDKNIPVMNGQQLIRLCKMKDLACDSNIYPDQGHGFEGTSLNDAQQRTLAFFKQHP